MFKNYWTDLLEIFKESAKVYSHCVCEITVLRIKRSEKVIKILAPLILGLQWWNKAELQLVCRAITGYLRYVEIFGLTREIRCHSDKNFQYLPSTSSMITLPPFIFFLFLAIYQCLRVFQFTFCWILACLRSPSALSFCMSVRASVCLSHLFHYVPVIVSSRNFQELLPMTEVMSMQKVKAIGQRSRLQVITQLSRFRTVTPVWIHIWWWNDA